MARIESQAVAGYYATPLHLTGPISALVTFPDVSEKKTPSRYHVMDPCAGDGAALYALIVNWFGADWRERGRYRNGVEKGLIHVRPSFVEMEQTRFEALRARERKEAGYGTLTDLVHGDALTLNWVPGVYGTDPPGMNVLFLNPPYEPDPVHGRMEHAFLLKFADVPVAGDGVLLFVVPFYALKASARLISCKYEDVRCYRFPDPDFDAYKQVVLCGRRRKFPLDDPDRDLEKQILAWSRSVEGLPTLGAEAGLYPLREQSAGLGALKTMALNVSAVLDRVDPSSLGQSGYDRTVEEMTTRVFPLGMRPREAHIAAAMGAGVFNGVRITASELGSDHDHGPLLLKAVFTKDWLKVEEKKNKKGETTAVVEQQQPKLNVVVLRLDTSEFAILKNTDQPTMRKGLSEWSIADLLLRYGKSLIEAMDRACPALHDPRRKGEALVLPKTLRTPFAAQSEAIQAAVKIAFTGESPYGLGEIGSGKTTLATALLWALAAQNYESTWQSVVRAEQARDKNLGSLSRAFGRVRKTAIRPVRAALVLCPPHLLKSWQDQCQAVIPGATVVVIREPADLVRIRALREVPIKVPPTAKPGKVLSLFGDHDQPVARVVAGTGLTVALLTRETAKLGHGYEHGYARNRTGKVSCPKCGTEFEAGTEEDAVRRRTRCEQTISTPANPPALLAIEISHRAAGLIKGGFGAGVLGRSRFGHKARGKTMPGAKDLFRLLTWAVQHPALFKTSYGMLTPAAEALVGAVQALALGMVATTDELERVSILLAILCRLVGRNTTPAQDLYLCRVARDHDLDDHARMYSALSSGVSTYDRVDFLSMAAAVRAAFTGQVLSASGNGTGTFTNRIKVVQVMTSAEVYYEGTIVGGSEWVDKFLSALRPLALWHKRACGEFLFQAAGLRRYPLASLISRSHKDLFEVVIGDEFHEYNNDGTAQERAYHRLTAIGAMNMGLSGSLMAGYAKQLFRNLWSLSPRFRREYKYTDLTRFCRQFGYYKRLVQVKDEKGQRAFDHGTTTDRVEKGMAEDKKLGDAPGFLPVGLIRFVLPVAVTMQKGDMIEALPTVEQFLIPVDMDEEVNRQFQGLSTALLGEIKRNRYVQDMAGRLLGALAELPSFLDRAASGEFTIKYPDEMRDGQGQIMDRAGQVVATAPGVDPSVILPKEARMITILEKEMEEGRNVIVFAWHTALVERYARLCQDVGRTVTLHADKVPTHKREAWIDKEVVGRGARILVVNSSTVQTGLNNLVYFSSAIWMENPHCDPTITRQANGRIDRIGQTRDVRIYTLIYDERMQRKCQDLLTAKIAVATATDGLDPSAALAMAGGGTGAQAALAALNMGKALFECMSEEE